MKTIIALLISLTFCVVCTPPSHAIFDDLETKIQKEINDNPFLKKQGINLIVTNEENGYVTIEMIAGNYVIRRSINDGSDILSEHNEQQWNSKNERESVTILRRTVNVIKKIEGVKEVLLTAAINDLTVVMSQFVSELQRGNLQAAYELCSNDIKKLPHGKFEKFRETYSQAPVIKSIAEMKIIKEEYKGNYGYAYQNQTKHPIKFIYEKDRWFLNDL